jgi:hypothetical protein
MEADVGNGLYNTYGTFVGFRMMELVDKIMENNGGTFIKLDAERLTYLSCYFDGRMYYKAIDVSGVKSVLEKIGNDNISHSATICTINCPVYNGDNMVQNGYILLGGSMILQNNHKICVPVCQSFYNVENESHDMRDSAGTTYPFPTEFVVGTVDSTIYLPDSYCSLGYNDFTIKQTNGKKAIVYGMMGDVVFDGTSQPDGVYRFRIYSDVGKPIDNTHCMALIEYDKWVITDGAGTIVSEYQWERIAT